jgi:hypothetical protein
MKFVNGNEKDDMLPPATEPQDRGLLFFSQTSSPLILCLPVRTLDDLHTISINQGFSAESNV